MKRLILTAAACSLSVLMTACHENKLAKVDESEGGRFLVKASQYAEKKQGLPRVLGDIYGYCMGKEEIKQIDCNKFFSYMQQYAETTKDFKGVTIADLTNKSSFSRLKRSYNHYALMQ